MRRIAKLMFILLVVWFSMLIGFWIIGRIIVPLEISNHFLSGFVRTVISIGMAVIWLWGWRKLAYHYFWSNLKRESTTS